MTMIPAGRDHGVDESNDDVIRDGDDSGEC